MEDQVEECMLETALSADSESKLAGNCPQKPWLDSKMKSEGARWAQGYFSGVSAAVCSHALACSSQVLSQGSTKTPVQLML